MGTTTKNILDYVLNSNLEHLTKEKAIELLVQWFDINAEMEQYLHVLLNEGSLKKDIANLVDLIMEHRGLYFFGIATLREHRLKERSITFEQFESEFHSNSVQALTRLFLEPMNEGKISKVKRKIKEGSISLRSLFDLHMMQPNKRLMSFVL